MEQYKVIKKIGSGSFSDVYLVLENSYLYAVKVFCKHTEYNIKNGFDNDVSKDYKFYETERRILERINKMRNCLNPRGYISTNQLINYRKKDSLHFTKRHNLPCILFDYYNSNLFELVSVLGFRFSNENFRRFARDFILVIYNLEKRGIYHCDIKPKNVLLSLDENNTFKYVLSDFTNSVLLPGDANKKNEYLTTLEYRSPERWNFSDFSEKSEVYSLGCVLYYILSNGKTLFEYENEEKMEWNDLNKKLKYETRKTVRKSLSKKYEKRIKELQLKKRDNVKYKLESLNNVDKNIIDLLKNMLKYNNKERYSISQCLEHPYFSVKKCVKRLRLKNKFESNKKMRYPNLQIG